MAAVHVRSLDRLDGPIVLTEYDPRWPALYAREARRIRAALGDRVRLLEHAGATSVPGLVAKPLIDIVLAVVDSAHEPGYAPALEAAGYVLRIREPDWHEHRLFKGPDTDVNLHVFTAGSPKSSACCASATGCATTPRHCERYAAAKRALAARRWRYVQEYADAKSDIVEAILRTTMNEPGR